MKKITHTKGLWIAVGALIEHVKDDVADIATFNPDNMHQKPAGRTYDEMAANAKLCAAAPQMLKLLKDLSKKMRKVAFFAVLKAQIDEVIKAAT